MTSYVSSQRFGGGWGTSSLSTCAFGLRGLLGFLAGLTSSSSSSSLSSSLAAAAGSGVERVDRRSGEGTVAVLVEAEAVGSYSVTRAE